MASVFESENAAVDAPLPIVEPIDERHIERVRGKGDVLDLTRRRMRVFAAHNTIRANLITTALSTSLLHADLGNPAPRHFAYGAVAGAAAEANRVIKNRRIGKKADAVIMGNKSLSERTGEPLELIRAKSRGRSGTATELYWNADIPEEYEEGDLASRLKKVTAVAVASNLDTVVVPAMVAAFANDPVYEEFKDRSSTVSDWLKQSKPKLPVVQLESDGVQERKVMQLTPEECLKIAESIEQLNDTTLNTFEYAWNVLRQSRPNHTVLRQFAGQLDKLASRTNRNGVHDRAKQTLARQIALTLDDTTVQKGPNGERVRVNMSGRIDSRDPIARLQGVTAIDTNSGHEAVHAEDSGQLLKQLRIEEVDLRLFFENPGKLSEKKRIQLAEVVLLYDLAGWKLPYQPDSVSQLDGRSHDDDQDALAGMSLQESVAFKLGTTTKAMRRRAKSANTKSSNEVTLERFRNKRSVRLFAVAAFALLLATDTASEALNAPANMLYDRQEQEYIDNLPGRDIEEILERINEGESEVSRTSREDLQRMLDEAEKDGEIDYRLYDDFRSEQPIDPYNWLLSEAYGLDLKIRDSLAGLSGIPGAGDQFADSGEVGADSDRAQENTEALGQQDEARVGNVDASVKNKPLWKLESNNMSTSGFWPQVTHNTLVAGYGMFWQSSYRSDTKTAVVESMSQDEVLESGAWIKVESVNPITMNRSYFYSEDALVPIPVREGTVPAYVVLKVGRLGSNQTTSVEGQILQLEDGTFMAAVEGGQHSLDGSKVLLEYTLVPADSRPSTPFGLPHAISGVMTDSLLTFDDEGNPQGQDLNVEAVDDAVDEYIFDLPVDGTDRTQALANRIKQDFQYALAPFGEDEEGTESYQDIKTAPEYVDIVFDTKKANCNVANTLLAIDNPELNVATGYNNDPDPNSPYDSLSIADGHMVAIDQDGRIYDATPSGASKEDAKYFEENFTEDDFKQPKSSADEWKRRYDIAKNIAAAGAIGLAAAYAIRKRKAIAATAKNAKRTAINKRGEIAQKRLKGIINTRPQAVRVATEVIGHAVFSNHPNAPKQVTKFTTLTPLDSKAVVAALRIANANTQAAAKLKSSSKAGAYSVREREAAKLAARLLKLSHYADRRY